MYRLARLSLAQRAVTALVTVAVAILGFVSLGSLKQELIPSVSFPTAAVLAVVPGSSPDVVEQQVTVPLENAVRGVRGVEDVTSTASTGLSVSTVTFTYGTDMADATSQLTAAISRVQRLLPADVDPQVLAGSIDDLPVVQLAAAGGTDPKALSQAVDEVLVPELEQLDDVRDVTVTGTATRQITLAVDPVGLAAAGLTPSDVSSVLQQNGITLPAGTVTEGHTTWSVQAGTPITSVEQLAALPLTSTTGTVVPLGDVVEVLDGEEAQTSFSRLDGEPSLAIAVTKTPAGNTVDVSHEVNDVLASAQDSLAARGVTVAVVFDQAPFIEESIQGLATEGGLGLLFAVVVILAFLASLRSTLVSAVSIPLSLLVAFAVMNVTGYTLNLLTLSALTIAIGRVVDDAIVVIENIKRHLSYGEPKGEAIIGAVREVGGAITASTVATVAVFAPIGFVGGVVGELFRPFAMTIAIAMGASLLVALTIVPVLAYWFLKEPAHVSAEEATRVREAAEAKERTGVWQRAYVPTLGAALRRPWVTIAVAVAVLVGTLALVPRLETNLLGSSGQDTATVTQTFEPGTSLQAQDDAAKVVEQTLADVPGVTTVLTTVGTDGFAAAFGGGTAPKATYSLTLDEDADAEAVQDDARAAVEDLDAAPTTQITVSGGDAAFGSSTVDLVITADDDDALSSVASTVTDAVSGVDGVQSVTNNLAADQQVVDVTVDRDKAAAVGLSETALAGMVAAVMQPSQIGQLDLGDGPVTVRMQVGDAPATVDALAAMPVVTAAGPVPLSSLASVEKVDVPSAITRMDGARTATVAVTPAGQDVGSLSASLQKVVDELDLPAGTHVELGGVAADQQDAFGDLGLALLLAIAIVYIVMVATFNSLAQPFILLVSVPFAATGALGALLLTGTPLGVPALIGMLMLVGIVVSNAIVLIDLINQYRTAGRPLREAVTEGARQRLRPIVMTAAATIFALLPMAFGATGGGAFISQPLALVVIGGLLSSTLLTLLVVPALYTLYEGRGERRAARRARRAEKRDQKRDQQGAGKPDAERATA